MKTQNIVICAWCYKTINDGILPASHGICEQCKHDIMLPLLKPEEWQPEDHQGRRLDQFLYSAWIVGSCILTGAIVIAAAILTAFL